jgi:putative hydrolase of the HAD superfamily
MVVLMKEETVIRAVILDFGGVLATEGFREGLEAIALSHGLDPAEFVTIAADAIYETGYITGRGTEAGFWDFLQRRTGIAGEDSYLTGEILRRFVVRPRMLAAVRALRANGIVTAILSDQTDWLERLEARDRFFLEFDKVFNSYRLGKGKRDATVFDDAVRALGVTPQETLFADDNPGHVERAASRGLLAVRFRDEDRFLAELDRRVGKTIAFR